MKRRFSAAFRKRLQKKIGDPAVFSEARRHYYQWRASISVTVISPFCNKCVSALRRDLASEPMEGRLEVADDRLHYRLPSAREIVYDAMMRGIDETVPPLTASQQNYLRHFTRVTADDRRIVEQDRWDRMATRILQLEKQYLEISHRFAQNAMRDPMNHPTVREREIVEYLRRKLESAREEFRRDQREAADRRRPNPNWVDAPSD